jgi:2-polyprenyl-6-methoxyphenol hydroxylase-like FAD-dependent oxidoreductase
VVGVRTASGDVHRAPLVVVADGRASRLRDLLGVGCEVRLLSYTATLSIDLELPSGPYGRNCTPGSPVRCRSSAA